MSIEEIVRTSMDQLARDLEPTMPNPAAVRAGVRRSRRIRSIAVVGLAAAIAAGTVVGIAEVRDRSNGSGPTPPVKSVETGVVDNAVWMSDGVLHIGSQAYPQDHEIHTALVPMKNGAVFGGSGDEIVYQPVDGPAQVLETDGETQPPSAPTPGPAADPDSDLVAILRWSTPDGRYDLYWYDAARGRQVAGGLPLGDDSFSLPGDPNPFGDTPVTPIEWAGPNDDGGYTALIRSGRELWRSDADRNGSASFAPVGQMPLDVTLDVFADTGPGGQLTFTTPAGKVLSSVDAVEPDGGLSHDGTYFAGFSTDPEHAGAIAIVTTHSGETRYLDPPNGTEPMLLSWSGGHTLMFRAPELENQPAGFVVACEADTLACANVAEEDDINTTVLPRL